MIDWSSKNIDLGRYSGRTSGHVKTTCPQCRDARHNKADRSLSCNLDTGAFRCHHCGWHGYATVSTNEEREAWMRQQPWYKEYTRRTTDTPKPSYATPPKPRSGSMDPRTVAWFANRGISLRTLQQLGVTDGTDWMPPHKNFRLPDGGKCTTIHFNYYRDGQCVATKLRSGDKCFRQLKSGCEQIAYNLDGIRNSDEAYIVEGEMDALSLAEIGYPCVVSVPDGGSDKTMHWLTDYYETHFADKKTVYLCVDNDPTGTGLCNELLKHFEPGVCTVVSDFGLKPDGSPCKDANDCLMYCGPDALRRFLDQGKTIRPEGDADMDKVADEMDDLYEHGLPEGTKIGLPPVDQIMRIQKGRLYIVTGTPGSGKSQLLDHFAVLLNVKSGWRFSVFSPEMMPLSLHGCMLVSKYTGRPYNKQELGRPLYEQARDRVRQAFHFIDPEEYELTGILDIAKYQIRKYGCDALIIDPWNDLTHQGVGISKTDDINDALRLILKFAHRQNVTCFVMAHPTKQERKKDGTYPKTTLNDISGGAHFRNRADFGFVIIRHRADDPDNTTGTDYTEFILEKTRFGNIAQLGTVYLRYQTGSGRFHPYDPITNVTSWDERNYLSEDYIQNTLDFPTAPAEADVQGFLSAATPVPDDDNNPFSNPPPPDQELPY